MLGMAGCQVHTEMADRAAPNGTGTVTVTVTLDHAAVTALGGQAALAAQLQDADLVAAGWAVTGPRPGPGRDGRHAPVTPSPTSPRPASWSRRWPAAAPPGPVPSL